MSPFFLFRIGYIVRKSNSFLWLDKNFIVPHFGFLLRKEKKTIAQTNKFSAQSTDIPINCSYTESKPNYFCLAFFKTKTDL